MAKDTLRMCIWGARGMCEKSSRGRGGCVKRAREGEGDGERGICEKSSRGREGRVTRTLGYG